MKMYCFSCRTDKEFSPSEEGPVCTCGHHQDSEAKGALEVCEMATWHDIDEYNEVAKIARSGGFKVADVPRNFVN